MEAPAAPPSAHAAESLVPEAKKQKLDGGVVEASEEMKVGHAAVGPSTETSAVGTGTGTEMNVDGATPGKAPNEPAAASSSSSSSSPRPMQAQEKGVKDDEATYQMFTNDGSNESSEALIALKNIFSRQLPKMPKEYIVRLVFDRRHYSLAICKHGRIIGGICYRPYYEQRFGEIAFCAINGTEQVKGYGTSLMNQLKHRVQQDKLEYFLTYADNYAIGYFQKQGFTKTVAMPRERWVGYIKDYDGGTLMECYIHPGMDYLNVQGIVARQKQFIYDRLKERSLAGRVYPGLSLFQNGERLVSALDAPGVMDAGWGVQHVFKGATERDRSQAHSRLIAQLKGFLDKIKASPHSSPFLDPVSAEEVPDYYETIKHPIDLSQIAQRLREGDYYRSKEQMRTELQLMVDNCRIFNPKESEYYESADALERLMNELFTDGGAGVHADGSAIGSSA